MDNIKERFGDLSFTSFVKNIIYESESGTMNGHWQTYTSRNIYFLFLFKNMWSTFLWVINKYQEGGE